MPHSIILKPHHGTERYRYGTNTVHYYGKVPYGTATRLFIVYCTVRYHTVPYYTLLGAFDTTCKCVILLVTQSNVDNLYELDVQDGHRGPKHISEYHRQIYAKGGIYINFLAYNRVGRQINKLMFFFSLFSTFYTRSACLAGDRAAASRKKLMQMASTRQLLMLSLKHKTTD